MSSAPLNPTMSPDWQFQPAATPVQPIKSAVCPHCQAAQRTHFLQRFRSGVMQLLVALAVIVLAVLRLARFAVAAAFSLISIVGTAFQAASQIVVHPDDRELLPRLPRKER